MLKLLFGPLSQETTLKNEVIQDSVPAHFDSFSLLSGPDCHDILGSKCSEIASARKAMLDAYLLPEQERNQAIEAAFNSFFDNADYLAGACQDMINVVMHLVIRRKFNSLIPPGAEYGGLHMCVRKRSNIAGDIIYFPRYPFYQDGTKDQFDIIGKNGKVYVETSTNVKVYVDDTSNNDGRRVYVDTPTKKKKT